MNQTEKGLDCGNSQAPTNGDNLQFEDSTNAGKRQGRWPWQESGDTAFWLAEEAQSAYNAVLRTIQDRGMIGGKTT